MLIVLILNNVYQKKVGQNIDPEGDEVDQSFSGFIISLLTQFLYFHFVEAPLVTTGIE